MSTRAFRRQLLLSTTLIASALTGYGRRAYGACVNTTGSQWECSGASAGQIIIDDDADVSTVAGFSVTAIGTGLGIIGNGDISYTDANASPIVAAAIALYIRSGGDIVAGNPGAVTVNTNGNLTGGNYGIYSQNFGSGALQITANGNVTGTSGVGIYARNNAGGTDLSVTTGGTVLGGTTGISTRNNGTGALDIIANGNVTGTGPFSKGIYARSYGTDLSVTTGTGTTVTGGYRGIDARKYGSGALDITANGNVSGTSTFGTGIFALNFSGSDLGITTATGTTVTGGQIGIYGRNYGTGAITITANGNVTGTNNVGISARNNGAGTDLIVTTAAGTTITGSGYGIVARSGGTGVLDITANGNVTGSALFGIYAGHQGTDLTVTTGPGSSVSGATGIFVASIGSGLHTITLNGSVTGTAGDGIYAASFGGTPINLTVASTGTVTSNGAGYGIEITGAAANVIVAGTVNGGGAGAISFDCACTDDRLELHTTAIINGLVLAGGGTDTFVLGGTGTGSFDVSAIGTQYQDFETFIKEDPSHWTLTGNNILVEDWFMTGGLLSVNATMAGWSFTVAGGTLGGTGTIGDLFVNAGGTVAPGNSIGTLHVADVTFDPGSFYQVEIDDAGNSDLIDASGVATIIGGTVQVLALPGTYVANTQYTIITTIGGRTGTFAGSTDNLAFLDAVLSYDAFNVYLNLVANSTSFSNVAQTPNQQAVAGALGTLPFGDPLVQAIIGQTNAGALQAFDALSGEIHASVGGMLVDESHFLRDSIFARLLQAFYGGGGTANVAALGGNGPAIAALGGTPMMGLGMGLGMGKGGGKAAPAPSSTGLVAWTQGFGSWGDFKSEGNAASADRTLGGFVSGVDAGFGGGWRAGVAGGYTQTSASVDARGSSADIESYHLAAYAGGALGPLALRSGAAWTWHEIETERAIVFPGFFQQADASYDGDTGQLFGELAMPLGAGKTALEAFGRLAYVHVSTGGFTESGGIAALTARENDENVTYSMLGARAATTMFIDGMHVTPHASAAWQHAFGDVTTDMALAFAGNGAGFTVSGVPIARDSAFLEAGLDFRIAPDTTLGVSYQGQVASDVQDHGLSGRLDWRF